MDKLQVIKIGGNVIDNASELETVLYSVASIKGPKILVHGGGKLASELSRSMGIEPQMVDGRRITSKQDLEIVTMVYAGLINKNITAQLQAFACNAVGLSGADGNAIASVKRPVNPINFGLVGDVKAVNTSFIKVLLDAGITPVFCAITHDETGQLLNTNADTIASELAASMSSYYTSELIYCFEKQGVLLNPEDEDSVIPILDEAQYLQLKSDKAIHSGMLPKLDNCFAALAKGVSRVIIGNSSFIEDRSLPHTTIIPKQA
ncbi:MAG: acetylglutamate kinase [Flavobacteriales bacterium]|nr:acetylglutamate kinase [Flavobacteriales bacterium]